MITTNSVPLPVSELNASSEMISEDRGEAIAEMRSSTFCGITTRSSASFALAGLAASGSELSLHVLSWHAVPCDPDHRPFQINDVGVAFAANRPARHSQYSRNPFPRGVVTFGAT